MKSLSVPFNLTGGRIATTTDYARIVEQKIMDVLVTGKLERPTMPLYGAGLQALLFENIDELVESDIKTDASLDLLESVSGVSILDMSIRKHPYEDSTSVVKVAYRIGSSAPQVLTFTVSTDILTEETGF